MHLDTEPNMRHRAADVPSADFVRAVSDFLDTDPADLLNELGYANRKDRPRPTPAPDKSIAANSARLPLR